MDERIECGEHQEIGEVSPGITIESRCTFRKADKEISVFNSDRHLHDAARPLFYEFCWKINEWKTSAIGFVASIMGGQSEMGITLFGSF
jgi:hypothetical protein